MLNEDKCSIVPYSRKRKPIIFSYAVENVALARRSLIKDLGVLFYPRFTFSDPLLILQEMLPDLMYTCRATKGTLKIPKLYAHSITHSCIQNWNMPR